jgi:hypothetical protein
MANTNVIPNVEGLIASLLQKLPAQEGTIMVADVVDELLLQELPSINVMIGQTASCRQPGYSPVEK